MSWLLNFPRSLARGPVTEPEKAFHRKNGLTMPKPPTAPEITVNELASALEAGETIQVLDVRPPAHVVSGRIDLVPENRFVNIVGSRLMTLEPAEIPLDTSKPVVVVCAQGQSSKPVTMHLQQLGVNARSVRGGMAAWMSMTVPRELTAPACLDRLIQLDRVGKGSLGYVLISDGKALLVDPPRNTQMYLTLCEEAAATMVGVADTHLHADYVSGGPALARELDVPYYLHPADAIYPYDGTPGRIEFHAIDEGTQIQVGRATITVRHTPGHTEGSVTYMIADEAALTGDFLFVASIGRPDLAGKTKEWTEQLWNSVQRAKSSWPAAVAVYPAHYSSGAERNGNRSVGVPLEKLFQENDALKFDTLDAFAAWIGQRTGSFPEQYRMIKAVNVGLMEVDDMQADELEIGKNECALS